MCVCLSHVSTMTSSPCDTSCCFDRHSRDADYAYVGYVLHFDRLNFQAEKLVRVSGTEDLWTKQNQYPILVTSLTK